MTKKILVVDDERDVVLIIKDRLKAEGYDVVTASNGQEALEKAADEKPDLIVLDVRMPDMDGIEALKRFKADDEGNNPVVVLLSAHAEKADMQAGWDHGADLYLTKPFAPAELTDFINCILDREPVRPGDLVPAESSVAN